MHVLRIHPGYVAAACAFAVVGLYLAVSGQQGNLGQGRVTFVAVSLFAAGAAAGAAEGDESLAAGLAAAWAAATLWIWAFLALFSIGILVVPAGLLATTALMRRRAPTVVIAAGIALALLPAVAGLVWTND
jgi:hypothetical protein